MLKIAGFMPDLIFMDIQLNGVSGLDLTKRIKAAIQKSPLSFSPRLIYRNTGKLPQIMERIVLLAPANYTRPTKYSFIPPEIS